MNPPRKTDRADLGFIVSACSLAVGAVFWMALKILEFVALVKWVFS